jgi:hypothetical protein
MGSWLCYSWQVMYSDYVNHTFTFSNYHAFTPFEPALKTCQSTVEFIWKLSVSDRSTAEPRFNDPWVRLLVTLTTPNLYFVRNWLQVQTSKRFFSSPQRPDLLWGPLSPLYMRWQVRFPQGREVDHSPPSNTVVKNCGAIPPFPRSYSCIVLN